MFAPLFVVTPVNDPIEEAVTKASDGSYKRPAFYTLTTQNGQVYAGSTNGIGNRLNDHKSMLRAGKHIYPELQNAVEKEQPIQVMVEHMPSRQAAYDAEQAFLTSNVGNPNLLNKSLDARNPGKGHTVSEAGIQRLREFNTGKILSAETRQKMSESRSGKAQNPATLEALIKARSKPVEIDGTVFPSLTDAVRTLRVSYPTIVKRVKSPDPKYANYSFKEKL